MVTKTQLSSRFKQVLYNTGFGIMVVVEDRNLLEVNPKFCEALGYTKEHLIGNNAEMIHTSNETYKEFGEGAFNLVRRKETVNLEWPSKKDGGTIDKFIGDPEIKGDGEDSNSYVLIALEMLEQMKYLCRIWEDQGASKPLKTRIGINTGYCNVGNFGSENRLDYTIVGGEVNLASRLESNAEARQILSPMRPTL